MGEVSVKIGIFIVAIGISMFLWYHISKNTNNTPIAVNTWEKQQGIFSKQVSKKIRIFFQKN